MKAADNTLYYAEEFFGGKLIDGDKNITQPNVKQVQLSEENCTKLRHLLEDGVSDMHHRCISVYRDAIVIRGNVYNVCLSCGDYFENEHHFYIENEKEIGEFLQELKDFSN